MKFPSVPVDWRDGRPNVASWLFTIEEWLVQGLVERILEELEPTWLGELLRGGGSKAQSPHFWQARQVAIKKHPGYGNSP